MKFDEFVEYLKTRVVEAREFYVKDLEFLIKDKPILNINGVETQFAEDYSITQFCRIIGLPARLEQLMSVAKPQTITNLVNDCVERAADRKVYVQFVNGKARAFRTEKFVPILHDEVMKLAQDVIGDLTPYDRVYSFSGVESWSYYASNVFEEIQGNDKLFAGVTISNSEVGHRMLRVGYFLFREICSNGLRESLYTKQCFERVHVGNILTDFKQALQRVKVELPDFLKAVKVCALKPVQLETALENMKKLRALSAKTELLIREAFKTEPISDNLYGFVGALSRVATHSEGLSDGARVALAQFAGDLLVDRSLAAAITVR